MDWQKIQVPSDGERITLNEDGTLGVPARPIIPWIEGDGIGVDISRATYPVLDAAVEKAYGGDRGIAWMEIYAGEKASEVYGELLPQETFDAVRHYRVSIKGPLTTPVGGGFRSLNVTLRQILDLYACVRPVRYIPGVPSPMKHPEKVDGVIFRENTEDVYAGIEWQSGSEEVAKIRSFLKESFDVDIREDSGIGVKPISRTGTQRLVRMALKYALEKGRSSLTLVHKGNIMKFTEGAFRDWGYELAASEFPDTTISEADYWKLENPSSNTKLMVKDRIADAMFQQVLLRADEYDVIACPNLNGDYLSDAMAAQVGGLGMAPGGNLGDGVALFEATHGTAPKYAGQDKVNPTSLILSGVMMLRHLGWDEAAALVEKGIEGAIGQKRVTYDLERQIEGATKVSCSEFGDAIIQNM